MWAHEVDEQHSNWSVKKFQLLECDGCASVTLKSSRVDSESLQHDPDGHEWLDDRSELIPARNELTVQLRIRADEWALPIEVRAVWSESIAAIDHELVIVGAMGLRATIEAICRDIGGAGKLQAMIARLKASGRLHDAHAKLFSELKDVGDESAHSFRRPDRAALAALLEDLDHVMYELYVLPKRRGDAPQF